MPSEIEFKEGFAVDYVFAVPECFRDALERNKFSAGDVFYDHPAAYRKKWGDALSDISVSLQVIDSIGGKIRFSILRPDSEKRRIVRTDEKTVSSEDFVGILKNGLK